MRTLAMVAVVTALVGVSAGSTPGNFAAQFAEFKQQYGRSYGSRAEEARRFRHFVDNMRRAAKLQRENPLAQFGMNEFSDVSPSEFKVRHNLDAKYANGRPEAPMLEVKQRAVGGSMDWRTKGAVTYVKNQGNCGSCWSFSATGSMEGQWFLAGNTLTPLSEQMLVSCDTTDDGCGGGIMTSGWNWIVESNNGQAVTEKAYPYTSGNTSVNGQCLLTPSMEVGAKITGGRSLETDESTMASFVSTSGPLSIAVYAETWLPYTGGIMTNCPADTLDHGVLIVGYDMENQPPYWIIKNSWGTGWGEKGYLRVQYGTNQCGLKEDPCTSIV